jgi:RHS repeat-associated protein
MTTAYRAAALIGVIRLNYASASDTLGDSLAYYVFPPTEILPMWNSQGRMDIILSPRYCAMDGTQQRCPWMDRQLGFGDYNNIVEAGPPSFMGSLLEDKVEQTFTQYRRNRFYDPVTGRFTQADPIGLAGGINDYGFAAGDPVNYSDPFGLCPICIAVVEWGPEILAAAGLTATTIALTHPKPLSEIFNTPFQSDITAGDLTGKTRDQVRDLAKDKGLVPKGDVTSPDYPRKWVDPVTGKERIRLDRGHTDPTTGQPYNDPKAAADHVHGYDPQGNPIKVDGNKHIPTTGD